MSSKHRRAAIAQQRVEYLYALAKKWISQGRIQDAQRAGIHLRKLASSHVLSISGIKQTMCKHCNLILLPGITCSVRIRKNRRVYRCDACKSVRRFGH